MRAGLDRLGIVQSRLRLQQLQQKERDREVEKHQEVLLRLLDGSLLGVKPGGNKNPPQ